MLSQGFTGAISKWNLMERFVLKMRLSSIFVAARLWLNGRKTECFISPYTAFAYQSSACFDIITVFEVGKCGGII